MFPRLYAIMDAALLPSVPGDVVETSELAFAEMLAQSGVGLIQYRNKQVSSRKLLEISRQLVSLLRPRGVRVIVNDRADVAAVAGAEGVHVGQEDLSVEAARAICGGKCWVGVSTHNLEQVRRAADTSADYIAVGPIFATATKANPDPVVGLELVRAARAATGKPLVAIGGITLERAAEVYGAGADCLAVGRDLICHADPAARVRAYLQLNSPAAKAPETKS